MNSPQEQAMALAATERDSEGRLVCVTVDSDPPLSSSADGTWLVAIDGSEHSLRAMTQAVYFARLMQHCAVHLINVEPWLSKEAAETELASRSWATTAKARCLLDESSVSWRLHGVMGEAAERIVSLSTRLGCTGIVIGSHGLGAAQALLLGSVAYKVIHLSRVSVLVVR